MDFLPFASITANRAVRRHFDGGRVDSTSTGPHADPAERPTSNFHGAAALRATVAGVLYRSARAVEPCGYSRPATR